MERFAFKIDAALRANLYKICRLCGIDNPSKVPILPMESEIIDLDEPSLSQKVYELVGFTVSQDDKMPQTMCSLCVDKINDFFEFREMCHATNKQTRKLLGLKQADPQTLMDVKPIFKSEPLPTGNKRGRKRKTDDNAKPTNSSELSLDAVKHEPVAWRKKQRLQQQQLLPASKTEIKEEPTDADGSLLGKKRRKASCSVCSERFASKEEAEEHRAAAHVPSIARYSCYACNQTHHNASDIKAHQLWHKLSKTPYQCPQCNASVANNYAFTRHLREHTPTTPIGLLVLDRECPLCKKTFLTNYFYNTHPCARRTRKCGGCSRALNTEVAYMRHAPHCPKIYLSHSKHIMPEVADHEAQMRIKNEYDVDNEESPAIENAAQSDMQPVVVLERLTSPLLRASLEPNSLGRNNERVSTKSYLKRVDQLLKNTMSTLVSIKHEPEVHIDDTGPQLQPVVEPTESEPDEDPPADYDDFRNDDSDDDESAAATAPDDGAPSVATAADHDAPAAATAADDDAAPADAPTVSVKQEIIDEAYEQQQLGDGVQIKQEPLKLKLKITKNHGQLNSSIVDDDDNDLQLQSKSAKKKKKRKHKERYRESEEATPSAENTDNAAEMPASSSAMVTIKQERVDENYEDVAQQAEFEPQATVMTSIPMLQLESSSFTEEQPAATSSSREPETEDVKPNRLELDRLMQITHIASGVAMAEEAMPTESAVEAVPNEAPAENAPKTARKSTSTKSTARKSTGGMSRAAPSSSSTPAVEMQLPQIVAVESGATMPFNIAIKPEPLNRGYADEHEEQTEQEQMAEATSEINHNEKVDEEAAYINNLDLSNVVIKQEKDLHISDVDINGSEADNLQCNGSRASEESDDDDDDDDDSASSADEAEENMDTYEEQDERIYQEIELPPLEEQAAVENAEVEEHCESEQMQVEPENTSVLEEATERALEQPQEPQMEPQVAESEKLESQPMQVESGPENENVENVEGTAITAVEATAILESSAEEEKSIAAEETPPAAQPEPELAPSSAPAFNFVITSVCSQAEETLPVDEPQTPEKSSHSEENVTCPEVNLSAPKESETLAQPFFDSSSTSTNYNCDEEQQNVLNHELSATEQAEEQLALPAVVEQQEMEAGTSSATPSCSENASSANEETENRINEQQQEHQRHERQQQQQRCEINDDSNINEIAENNNNANIERELNDDANVAPQENPNI